MSYSKFSRNKIQALQRNVSPLRPLAARNGQHKQPSPQRLQQRTTNRLFRLELDDVRKSLRKKRYSRYDNFPSFRSLRSNNFHQKYHRELVFHPKHRRNSSKCNSRNGTIGVGVRYCWVPYSGDTDRAFSRLCGSPCQSLRRMPLFGPI